MHYVYILECADGSYYVGQTHDLRTRLEEHDHGTASAWTARRLPVHLACYERQKDLSAAVLREKEIKGWGRQKKKQFIDSFGWSKNTALAVYGFVSDDRGRLLLMKHSDRNLWMLPGGGVEDGEGLKEALAREIKEETGYAVSVRDAVGIDERPREHKCIVCFTCRAESGNFQENNEASAIEWFSPDELPLREMTDSSRRRTEAFLKRGREMFLINSLNAN